MSLTDPIVRSVVTPGATLAVCDAGQGSPALVFLHYWGGSASTWQPVVGRLSPEHRCIAYDHRGWGGSRANADAFAIGDLADDALALVHTLELDDYVLVGHSMGGKVAQVVAGARPAGLRGVVLVAPAPATPAVVLPLQARTQLLGAYASRESVLEALDAVLSHAALSDGVREQVVRDSLGGTPQATRAWPLKAINEDVSGELSAVDVPVLVIAGDHDQVEPVALLREHVVPAMPGARLEVIADSGHLIPLEQPEQLAERLSAFVAAL